MKMLLIFPHPDDEVYGASGTLMEFLAEGHICGLVTLTRGEAGRTLGLAEDAEGLAVLRAKELSDCLSVIGLPIHEQHQFPDKYLSEHPFEELVTVARDALARHQPEIVLTFAPNGSNGHPDHVVTHQAVKAAWDGLAEEQRPRLWYYSNITPPAKEELLALWRKPNIHHDVSPFLTRKLKAIACHRSQALSTVDFIRQFPERITIETFYEVGLDDKA